jgi:carbonyl reductase 1
MVMFVLFNTIAFLAAIPKSGSTVALITGSNKGIGKEIARKLAATPDMTVILGCRNLELGASAAKELAACAWPPPKQADVAVQRIDLAELATVEAARDAIASEYGRLDVLVNNAAICFNDPTLYGRTTYTPFEQQASTTLQTNFFGTLALTRAMLPLLRASPSPRIINVASAAGRLRGSAEKIAALTSPTLSLTNLEALMCSFVSDAEAGMHQARGWPNTCYGVSKMGLIAMSRVLARDEPAIMVNSVDPGYCATDQNDHQGYVSAERGARTSALLATLPAENFVSGAHWLEEREIDWTYL